LLTDYSKVSG